jgi:hypothetical protein
MAFSTPFEGSNDRTSGSVEGSGCGIGGCLRSAVRDQAIISAQTFCRNTLISWG